MTILVTGGSGTIGTQLLKQLSGKGVTVHAVTRDPSKAKFPEDVIPVHGDMLDINSMRIALSKASTLFLLNAVSPDGLSQAMFTLNLPREAGLQRVVYLSAFNSKAFTKVPHFVEELTKLLGGPLRSYENFATETLAHWQA